MATMTKMTIKLLIDRKTNRVLFGEAEKDVVDFLFSLFSLPVGSVTRLLLKNIKMVGCLGDLYESIETLNENYMQPNRSKDSILKPKLPAVCGGGSEVSLLLTNENVSPTTIEETAPTKYYICNYCKRYISNIYGTACPCSYRTIDTEIAYCGASVTKETPAKMNVGFVRGLVTYMVMDNLVVTPMSTISSITLLNKLNVLDIGSLEEKVVELGVEEGLALLKASFQSKTVLSDVYLRNKLEA